MKYPDWAPPSLVEMHIEELNEPAEYLGFEEQLSRILEEDKLAGRVSKGEENIRAKLYRSNLRLPQEQRTKLLGKLAIRHFLGETLQVRRLACLTGVDDRLFAFGPRPKPTGAVEDD